MMKISLHWLKDYVTTGVSKEKLAHKLTMAGLEVEKIASVGGDTVFELEITPNRPDCLSMLGMAREAAAILDKTLKFPKIQKRTWPKKKCTIEISDKQGCSRYIGTLIEGVSIGKADQEITKRLGALSIRPVNNVVDITNFCLMETGQPLHAFDYDKLIGGKIIVRRARKGEKIITLDNVERTLDPSVLVIADERRPVAIAGIMGGKDTEVTAKTKNILLESAYFNPVLIRCTSRKLALSSDSSYRFERGVDNNMVEDGANRAIDLILKSARGKLTGRTDATANKKKAIKKSIAISTDDINARIGTSLTAVRCKNILKKLAFHVTEKKGGAFNITPPSFRNDVKGGEDIIEEVSRIIGYDEVPLSFPKIKVSEISTDSKRNVRREVRDLFLAQGFNEIITYTMISRKDLAKSSQENLPAVAVFNPLTQDQEIMRPLMLPSFLPTLLFNINRGEKNIKFFETGKVYTAKGEQDVLGIIMTGLCSDDWRQGNKENVNYYDLKGALEQTLTRIGIKETKIQFQAGEESFLVKGQSAAVFVDGKHIGNAGKIKQDVLSSWDIKHRDVFFAQIEMDQIYACKRNHRKYKPVSEFPAISRDISLAVKENITAFNVEEVIRKIVRSGNQVALADIKFVEQYEGKEIPPPTSRPGIFFNLSITFGENIA